MAKRQVGEVVKIRKDLQSGVDYLMIPMAGIELIGNKVSSPKKLAMAGLEVTIEEICADCGQYIINGEHFTDEMFEGYEAPVLAVGDYVQLIDKINPVFPWKARFVQNPMAVITMDMAVNIAKSKYVNKSLVGIITKFEENGNKVYVDVPEFTQVIGKVAPFSVEMLYKITKEEYEANLVEVKEEVQETASDTFVIGMKVRIKNDLEVDKEYGSVSMATEMLEFTGKEGTITEFCPCGCGAFRLDTTGKYGWSQDMVEVAKEDLN